VLETSGAPTLVAEQALTEAQCPQPPVHGRGTPPRSFIALGDACIFEGTFARTGLAGKDGTCTLDFSEGRRTIHVSSVSGAWHAPIRYGGSYDRGVTLTGEDAATGQQVLYRLIITKVAVDDASRRRLCDRMRASEAAPVAGDPSAAY
jgi:hypothetical protein